MSEQTITMTVAYGSSKHSITVTGHEGGKGPTVKDLSDALAQATGVPPASQKLIFKGKSLKDMEESLSSYGIKEGCKLMMIGKRNSPEEEAELRKLKDIEKSVEQMAKKLEKVDGELTGLKNGFLAKDLQAEALGKLDHRVKIAAEQFMKILEEIDAMNIPENFNDCRMKKKGLVKTVQVSVFVFPSDKTIMLYLKTTENKNKTDLYHMFTGFPRPVRQDRGLYIRPSIKDPVKKPGFGRIVKSLLSLVLYIAL
uniref:BAG family molecular chaperone regulator 1 n=1 Tax=Oreochromis niloticus TaxID=8128 RepID=A0A669ET64_ORENI